MNDQATKSDNKPVATTESLSLPMPCHFVDKGEWKPGSIVHFFMTGHGPQALIKPTDSSRFVHADLSTQVMHGSTKPETPAK